MDSAIKTENLSKTYGGKRKSPIEALRNLNLDVPRGEVFGFLGPNGAGKSTTIKLLMGLIRPTTGSSKIMGLDTGSPKSRQHVGYLPENPSFYDYLNAEEYLEFIGKVFGMDRTSLTEKKERVLELLELKDAMRRPIRSYSKGMVQRLGLAQVLIHDPDVYILDEPMSGLDPIGRALVKKIIVDLKSQGKCVFFSTHITDDVEAVCDRVGIIVKGTLKRVEKVETIMTEGIVGYTIHVKEKGSNVQRQVLVPRHAFSDFVSNSGAAGNEITLVEPRRKNLEDFFLDIVRGPGAEG